MVFLLHVCDINYSSHMKNVTCQILKYGIQSLFTVWRTHSQTSFLVGENQIRISILSQSLKLIFFFLQCILNQIYKVHVLIFIFRHLHILELSKGCFCIQELNLVKKMSYYVSIIFRSQYIN